MRFARRARSGSRVPDGAAQPPDRRAPRGRPRRDLARRRRSRPAAERRPRARRSRRRVRRDDVAHYPTNRGLRRAAARRWRGSTRTRFGVELDPETRGRAAARRQGGPRAPRARAARPRRRRAGGRSGLSGLRRRPAAGRRRARTACRCCPSSASSPTSTPCRPRVRERANLLILGYPNNPTGAVVDDATCSRAWSSVRRPGLPRQRLLGDHVRRLRRAELPRGARRARGGHRDPVAVEGVQPARLADRVRGRQRRRWSATCCASRRTSTPACSRALQHAAIALLDSDPAERRALAGHLPAAARPGLRRARRGRRWRSSRPRGGMYVWLPVPGGEGRWRSPSASSTRATSSSPRASPTEPRGEGFVRLALTAARGPAGRGLRAADPRPVGFAGLGRLPFHIVRDAEPERAVVMAVWPSGFDGDAELDEMDELLRTAGGRRRRADRAAPPAARTRARTSAPASSTSCRRSRTRSTPRWWSATTS